VSATLHPKGRGPSVPKILGISYMRTQAEKAINYCRVHHECWRAICLR